MAGPESTAGGGGVAGGVGDGVSVSLVGCGATVLVGELTVPWVSTRGASDALLLLHPVSMASARAALMAAVVVVVCRATGYGGFIAISLSVWASEYRADALIGI